MSEDVEVPVPAGESVGSMGSKGEESPPTVIEEQPEPVPEETEETAGEAVPPPAETSVPPPAEKTADDNAGL